jgi:hypothetical protein
MAFGGSPGRSPKGPPGERWGDGHGEKLLLVRGGGGGGGGAAAPAFGFGFRARPCWDCRRLGFLWFRVWALGLRLRVCWMKG